MFNKDFYPTPREVIDRMLLGVDVFNKVVLEPSAGKGNIVDALKEYGAKEIIACENCTDLAKIVAAKCNLIAHDFLRLTSEQVSHIDMIVMNPPFSADEKHILHAYDIAPSGCEIIALCNMSTMTNAYSTIRKQLREIIELNGRWERFDQCFSGSERHTDVLVACIRIFKPGTKETEFDNYFSLSEDHEQQTGEGIMSYNSVREIVNRYVGAVKMFDDVIEASNRINELASGIDGCNIKFGAYEKGERNYDVSITREKYKKELQKAAWRTVLNKMNMGKYATTKVRENINLFVEQQQHVPFTMHNVYRMIELVIGTHGNRMNDTLVESFDQICSFSHENSTAGEKWKTNSDYMVNRRFIVPYITNYNFYGSLYQHVNLSYCGYSRLDDVVKALCFLTGTNYDDTTPIGDFVRNMKMEWGKWYNWGFFRIRGYKKGTMHFEFQDEDIWMKFNTEVARIKGWALPRTTKKARAKTTDIEMFQ